MVKELDYGDKRQLLELLKAYDKGELDTIKIPYTMISDEEFNRQKKYIRDFIQERILRPDEARVLCKEMNAILQLPTLNLKQIKQWYKKINKN